jgi:hypothetical protein
MMLILKYFLVVGAVLTLGLIALNAHLLPDGSKPPAAVIHSATTASLPTVAPNVPAPETAVAAEPVQPPPKSAAPTRRSHHSARVQRRSHWHPAPSLKRTFAKMSQRRNFSRR